MEVDTIFLKILRSWDKNVQLRILAETPYNMDMHRYSLLHKILSLKPVKPWVTTDEWDTLGDSDHFIRNVQRKLN
jgi:hypothetical protein